MFAVRKIARRRPRLVDLGIALVMGACAALSQVPTLAAAVAAAGVLMVALAPRS